MRWTLCPPVPETPVSQRGANESLAGRFFLHRCLHWSFPECRKASGWDLEHWLYFGVYPGAAPLIEDDAEFRTYVRDHLIEPPCLASGLDRSKAGRAAGRGSISKLTSGAAPS